MKKLFLILFLFAVTSGVFAQSVPEPVKYMKSGRDTVNSANDTISRKISGTLNSVKTYSNEWFQGVFSTDDTIQVSTDTLYTNQIIIYPGEAVTTPKFNSRYFNNLYWKILGTGTAIVRYWFFSF